MSLDSHEVGGVILCGGQSKRMGRPKAWLPFGDETMLQRVVRILREVVEPVVVVAAPNQDVPALPAGVEIVHDEVEGKGPLAGLAAGLAALEGKADAVLAASIFHFGEYTVGDVKKFLADRGILVRQ